MTLLITPNGFPLECTRDEYEVTAEKVNRVIAAIEPSDEINFSVQLDLLTVFTELKLSFFDIAWTLFRRLCVL